MYTLPVIPIQLEAAGYDRTKSIQITALGTGIGCVVSSYITNLPFVIAPPSSVAIFVAVALQENGMKQAQGDAAVILSGFALLFIGTCHPLLRFATKLIPDCIQASTAIGIGLITALAGAIELRLVVPGKYAILQMGPITPEIVIAFVATTMIAIALYHKIKGAYTIGLLFGTITWWMYSGDWPQSVSSIPHFSVNVDLALDSKVILLFLNLVFLYIITLSGIARTLADLAHLTSPDGSIPHGNWLFIVCGVSTIVSGYFSGPPILISPESTPGIKSGARTGFSMLICGLLYTLSVLFCPVFERIPPAGTSPLLILVGLTLFVNSGRIRWSAPDESIPAFFVLLLIPFTFSILTGVGVGYVFYILIGVFTGQLQKKVKRAMHTFQREAPTSSTSMDLYYPAAQSNTADDFICGWEEGSTEVPAFTHSESFTLNPITLSSGSTAERFDSAQTHESNNSSPHTPDSRTPGPRSVSRSRAGSYLEKSDMDLANSIKPFACIA